MGARVEFVFGLGSRYSYLASTQLASIAARTGSSFTWVPVSSVALMAARGSSAFQGAPVSGQYEAAYRKQDAEDWAQYYGVPYVESLPPPTDHALMAVAALAAGEQGALERYARALFEQVFVAHAAIDAAACVRLAASLRLNAGYFEKALASAALRAQAEHDASTYAARGAFGVPTFFVGERMFWGNDRLVILEDWLMRHP
jgi:2-hydroxychromene-2-carboxylate isomerase